MKENEQEMIIIGVPGKWKDRRELTTALALGSVENGGYLILGDVIMDSKKESSFDVVIYEHDENLKQTFYYAGNERLDSALLEEIDQHTATVYIIAKNDGLDTVKALVNAVTDVLNAGGLAVKIETSGVAHSKESWLKMREEMDEVLIYQHFIALANYEKYISSFGMKGFGLPDVIMYNSSLSLEEVCELLNRFNLYHLYSQPVINSGETYSVALDAPFYRMTFIKDDRYEEDDIFHNPYGLIKMEELSEKEERNKRNILARYWNKDK